MDSELKKMLSQIIALLDEIKSNTEDLFWIKSAVEDVERAVKSLKR